MTSVSCKTLNEPLLNGISNLNFRPPKKFYGSFGNGYSYKIEMQLIERNQSAKFSYTFIVASDSLKPACQATI